MFSTVFRQKSKSFLSRNNFLLNYCSQSMFSTKVLYSKQHEYAQVEGPNSARIGITDFAQNALGDVVYVELPCIGDKFEKGDIFGSVESVKAASDVYMPATGEIVEINEALSEDPHLVNDAAMTDGWFVKVQMDSPAELDDLMDDQSYKIHCESEEH